MDCGAQVETGPCGRRQHHLGVHRAPGEPQFQRVHPVGEDCGGQGCPHCARVFLGGLVEDNPLRLRRSDIPRYLAEAGPCLRRFVVAELLHFRPDWEREVTEVLLEMGEEGR